MNLKQLSKLYLALAPARTPILTLSGPGLGKTGVAHQTCELLSSTMLKPWTYCPVIMTNHDPIDIGGFMVPRALPDGTLISQFTQPFFWDQIKDADGVDKFAMLHFDELADADLAGQKIAARAIYDRMVGVHRLPDGVWVIASGNRKKDKSGVQRMATMVQNRLLEINVEYDMQTHLDYLMPKGFNPSALAFIRTNPGLIYSDTVPNDPGPFCSPRSFEAGINDLVQLAQSYGLPAPELLPRGLATGVNKKQAAALANEHYKLASEVLTGRIGPGAATQFFVHLKYADQLPTMDELAANPQKAKLPDDLGGQFQISYTMAQTASEKQLPAVVEYMQRMNVEFQVVTMKGLLDRQHKKGELPGLMSTPGVGKWCQAHKEVIFMSA